MEGRGPIWQGLVGTGEFWSYCPKRYQTEGSDRKRWKPLYFFVDIFWGSRFQSRWCSWKTVGAPSGRRWLGAIGCNPSRSQEWPGRVTRAWEMLFWLHGNRWVVCPSSGLSNQVLLSSPLHSLCTPTLSAAFSVPMASWPHRSPLASSTLSRKRFHPEPVLHHQSY